MNGLRALLYPTLLFSGLLPAADAQDERAARLVDELSGGRWTRDAREAYGELALERARAACGARVSPEFWEWLARTPKVREVVVWATAADPPPSVFVRLDRLRAHDPDEVEELPDLAVGFAFAWSAGDDDRPRRQWESWTQGRAPIPSMSESFAWYAQHRRRLASPVEGTCWQLLAYTALNDVPLEERAWVLERYRGKDVDELHGLFGEVPYVQGGLDGKARTLANMLEFGGVCTVNTQYHMAVMRTLGVPATFGGGPGHCWPCWIAHERGDPVFARVNDLGNADGVLGERGLAGHERESDLRLLARALDHGPERLRDAELCAAALRCLGADAPHSACAALARELDGNPYALQAWLTAARSVGAQRATSRTGVALLDRLSRSLGEYPRATLRVLRAAIPAQDSPGFDERTAEAFVRACSRLDGDPELATDVRRTLIEFEARAGSAEEAARMRLALLRETQDDGAAVDSAGLVRTRTLGGGGGGAFVDRAPDDACLVGMRYSTAVWSGHRILASIQPLYSDGSGVTAGRIHGRPGSDVREILVPPGSVVIGVEVVSGAMLDGLRLVSAARRSGENDDEDLRFGEWAGGSGDGWGALLGATGGAVVGIHGRCGTMVDALGLVTGREE